MKRFAITATALLGACSLYFGNSGPSPVEDDQDPQSTPDASIPPTGDFQEFAANVYPVLSAECFGCHLGAGPETLFGASANTADVYKAVIDDRALTGCGNPAASELLTKGAHEGPAITAMQAQAIAQWLTDAAADGDLSCDSPPPPAGPALLAEEQFAACESVSGQAITTSGADQLASVNTDDGKCSSCHEPDLASASSTLAYWETEIGLENYFTTQIAANGAYQVVFDSAAVAAKGSELANGTGTHPAFTLSKTITDAMAQFVADVDSLEDAGECPPPAFGPF